MDSRAVRAALGGAALLLALAAPALAHSGEAGSGIECEPAQISAGGTVVLAGTGLEPDSDREINLVGPDVVVPFDKVTTDADGMFSVTLTIPSHLPAGTYTFQAIGDETLTTELIVTAAAGQTVAEPKNEAAAVVASRERSTVEVGLIAIIVLVSLAGGLLLVIKAERFGRRPDAASPEVRSAP